MSKPGFPITMDQDQLCHNSYKPWNGPIGTGTDNLTHSHYRYEDKAGDNTPGWPRAIRTNWYLRSVFTWTQNPLSVNGTVSDGLGHTDVFFGDWGNGFGIGRIPWLLPGNPFNLDAEVGMIRDLLIGKIIDNIQSHRVNLGEILHTRAQTASMVASTANRLVGAIVSLRKGNFVGAARYLTGSDPKTGPKAGLRGIPEQWLSLQYGWKPLIQDVYNSCETVRRAWNSNGDLFTAKASKALTGAKVSIDVPRTVGHGPSFSCLSEGDRTVRGKAEVVYGVDSDYGSSLSQLGITNPASLAWELLPYSFVADWFLPIGSFLERLDYANGLVFKHGYISIVSRQRATWRIKDSHGQNGNISANWTGGSGSGDAFVLTREALTAFPPVPPPHFKDPFSLTHVANALSLLATAFRGGKIPR